VGYDPATGRALPFQQTAQRRRTHEVAAIAARVPTRYYAFDLLALDGRDTMVLPQRDRSRQLREVLHDDPHGALVVTPQIETANAAVLERFFLAMVAQGHEGVVAKRPDAPYRAGVRSFDWVKLKREYQTALTDTFDVVVVGYMRGRGRRARLGIGSLLCAVYDPEQDRYRTVTRVGSGLSDAEWMSLKQALDAIRVPEQPRQVDARIVPDVWVTPLYVVEVIAAEVSRSPLHTCGRVGSEPGYALRFPRILRIRDDRRPEDATTEAEIKDFYQERAAGGGQRAPSG
jgi:DNA ligase-1